MLRIKTIIVASLITVVVLLPTLGSTDVLTESCVGAWLLDETSGAIARDDSGYDNDGTIEGSVSFVNGKFNGAFSFEAGGDGEAQVKIPNSQSLNVTEFTVTLWSKLKEVGDGYWIWGIGLYGGDKGIVAYAADGCTHFKFRYCVVGGGCSKHSFNSNFYDDNWRHVAVTKDEEHLKVYVDGEPIAEQGIGRLNTSSEPFIIGGGIAGVPSTQGVLDDVGFFNVPLEPDDIIRLMDNGLDAYTKGRAMESQEKLATSWGRIKSP